MSPVMLQEAFEKLISRIYDDAAYASETDGCTLCTSAAVWSKYSNEEIPDFTTGIFFQHANLLLQDTIEEDILTSMRVSIGVSVYLILVKRTRARR